jgi:hypothetical protein
VRFVAVLAQTSTAKLPDEAVMGNELVAVAINTLRIIDWRAFFLIISDPSGRTIIN